MPKFSVAKVRQKSSPPSYQHVLQNWEQRQKSCLAKMGRGDGRGRIKKSFLRAITLLLVIKTLSCIYINLFKTF